MKQFKLLSYLLIAVLSLGFVSCSDDDDDYKADDIIGNWQVIRQEGWTKVDGGDKEEFDDNLTENEIIYMIKADGKGRAYKQDIQTIYDIRWTIKGSTLTITEVESGETDRQGTIAINGDKMTLLENYKDKNIEYYFLYTLKKRSDIEE